MSGAPCGCDPEAKWVCARHDVGSESILPRPKMVAVEDYWVFHDANGDLWRIDQTRARDVPVTISLLNRSRC